MKNRVVVEQTPLKNHEPVNMFTDSVTIRIANAEDSVDCFRPC